MTYHQGIYWPTDVGNKWQHSLRHVLNLEPTLALCTAHRTAVQAGGNIGLWPRRMAQFFRKVWTFEPEPLSFECLCKNIPDNVTPFPDALGAELGWCGIERQSLGSHRMIVDGSVAVIPVDDLGFEDVDLLQLDVEGYEWHALKGAEQTIARSHPVIHLELRDFTAQYGQSDAAVRGLLAGWGYREQSKLPGNDFVYVWQGA